MTDKSGNSFNPGIVILLLMVVVGAFILSKGCDNSSPKPNMPTEAQIAQGQRNDVIRRLPEGFTPIDSADGSLIGYKWLKPKEYSCETHNGTCFGVSFITPIPCDSLYAEATLLDGDGANIDWTNGSLKGVRAWEVTKLTFTTYKNGVRSARLSKVNCT